MRKGWRSTAQVVRELVFGPDGPGAATAISIALQQTHAPLAGDMGRRVFGMKGDPSTTFSGWVVNPQSFVGAAQMGSTPTPPWEEPPAYPSTTAPAALPDWLETWVHDEGLVP